MTDQQADELLRNNDWAKWSDARELVLLAAGLGAAAERERCARFGLLLCELIEHPAAGDFCTLLPPEMLERWQRLCDEHIQGPNV